MGWRIRMAHLANDTKGELLMKVLFARIGYMKFYQGPQRGDEKPIGGGKYNKSGIGHEAFNFKNIDGKLYGYFQPHMKDPYEIKLERIDPSSAKKSSVENVLVIWFARNPIGGGQVIVGWYKNATVYREIQKDNPLPERHNYYHNVSCFTKDATLLPITKRKYQIGHNFKSKHGNPGQANAFYILENDLQPKDSSKRENSWIYKAIDYVENYTGPRISTFEDEVAEEINTAVFASGGQGFNTDIEKRLIIEKYAMNQCREYFEKRGYILKDVSSVYSYDFEATKGPSEKLFIEVKGTQTEGINIILTKNEVEMANKYPSKMVLFLVHSIELGKRKIKRSAIKIVKPWVVSQSRLTPICYSYSLGEH